MSIKKNPWFVLTLFSVAVPALIVAAKVAEYLSLKTATRRRIADLERAERDAGCCWEGDKETWGPEGHQCQYCLDSESWDR
jgi:hypothetical protein